MLTKMKKHKKNEIHQKLSTVYIKTHLKKIQ